MSHPGFRSIVLRAAVLAALSAPLSAANLWFGRDMPISQMSDADIAILSAAVQETLTDVEDGATQRWSNPETGAGGVLTPLSTYQERGLQCRQLEVANEAGRRTARSVLDYCQDADGTWKLRSGPAPAAPGSE